jgi:hypothetical protein
MTIPSISTASSIQWGAFSKAIHDYTELLKGIKPGQLTHFIMPRQTGKSTLMQAYSRGFLDKVDIPARRGRKGKPHWRYFRALRHDRAWSTQWANIVKVYENHISENDSDYKFWYFIDERKLAEWLRPQLINCTIRFDPQYNKRIAVDFDDEAARTTFYLQWA